MKSIYSLGSILFISGLGFSQTVSSEYLDVNGVETQISDGGVFFNNNSQEYAAYHVQPDSQQNAIYSMSFWYGGVDMNSQVKLSAQQYQPLSDQFKGPLTNLTALPDLSGAWDNSLFPVLRSEILAHQANYMNPGYVVPANIANWPAHGDIANNFDYYLAPFVDVDLDGNYVPENGDYPCVRGDKAIYVIMNDKGDVHVSGGDPIGIEMHYMFYQYSTLDDVNNTTFVYGKAINRGTQTLQDFKVSMFLDGDIGFFGDDYFGSDSSRNLMYFYNGDNMDESGAGTTGYLSAPPAVGVVSLTKDFESIGIASGTINSVVAYWNLMNGIDVSGVPWANPVTMNPTHYMFGSAPENPGEYDSEVVQMNPPGDRRGIATLNFGQFSYNDVVEFDYAIVYNRNLIDNVDNAAGLRTVADNVQSFFDTTVVNDCVGSLVGLNQLSELDFAIYPNPSNGQFTISIGSDFSQAEIDVYDISGRRVIERKVLKSKESMININESTGVYLLHLKVDGREVVKRIVIE